MPEATHCAECGKAIGKLRGRRAPCSGTWLISRVELVWCSPECLDAAVIRSNPSFRTLYARRILAELRSKKGTPPEDI